MKLKNFLSLLLITASFIGFSSCEENDEDDSRPITGLWQYQSSQVVVHANPDTYKSEIQNALSSISSIPLISFSALFEENGTCEIKTQSTTQTSYTYENRELTVNQDLSIIGLQGGILPFYVSFNDANLVLRVDATKALKDAPALQNLLENKRKWNIITINLEIEMAPVYTGS